MDSLLMMISCNCGRENPNSSHEAGFAPLCITTEKPRPSPPLSYYRSGTCSAEAQAVADNVISILRSAEKDGRELIQKIDEAVGTQGWTEWIAERVLNGIKAILEGNRENMGNAMAVAYDRASEAADAVFTFAKDHPLAMAGMLIIVAIGILVILAPVFVEALGFAELGPVEGSFAAGWESTYAGYIPKGSLFSFLQRLGMVWGQA